MNSESLLTGKRAVIVEDEGVTVLQLGKALTSARLKVVGYASNAQDAVRVVLTERPDLVLMDITMPGDQNGLDAAETILSSFPVCVVMVTAYDEPTRRTRAADIQTSGYLIKPIGADRLIPELEEAFGQWLQAGT